MKVHIPHGAFLGNIDQFLTSYDPEDQESLDITTADRWFWAHPMVLSMIAILGDGVPKKKITCGKITSLSGHYLERMGLFSALGIDSRMKITEHDSSGRFIPLTRVINSTELTGLITDMIPLLHLNPKQAQAINYITSEMVRNVLEHACTVGGAMVCAQYYKESNSIRIGVADRGIGIKDSMSQSYNVGSDLEAIKLAMVPGITGTTRREGGSAENAGAGLFFTKSIASTNRDFFVIISGNAMYKLLKKSSSTGIELHADPDDDRHSERQDLKKWQGTVIGIDMSLSATSEFDTLLDYIRNVYAETVRERKRQRLKMQPKFT